MAAPLQRGAATSAHAAASEQVDDGKQHHRPDKGPEQADRAERTERRAHAEHPAQDVAQEGADDADHDVQDDALLRIGAHDDARQPAADAADNKRDDDVYEYCSLNGPIRRTSRGRWEESEFGKG